MVKEKLHVDTKDDDSQLGSASSKATQPKMPRVRKLVQGGIFSLIIISLFFGIGSGTICSVGYDSIAAICPVGILESFFGSGTFVARAIIILIIVGLLVFFVGKAFCSWMCPIMPLDRFLSSRKRRSRDKAERSQAAQYVSKQLDTCEACNTCGSGLSCEIAAAKDAEGITSDSSLGRKAADSDASSKKRRFAKIDGRHVVLGGSLLSAAVCGFPVFCLICPVGLTFATAIALYRLVGFNEPTLDLVIFPLIIVVELVFLRKWCHRFCPISALMSLVANFNSTTRPKVNVERCLRADGSPCVICSAACPEFIDPADDLGKRALAECTRCGQCVQACPTNALRFTKKGFFHGK